MQYGIPSTISGAACFLFSVTTGFASAGPGDGRMGMPPGISPVTELPAADIAQSQMPEPVPLPRGIEIQKHVVVADAGLKGTGMGGVADAVESTLVYSNTLGPSLFGPGSSAATVLIADDIAITRVSGCLLDKYVTLVSGDRNGDGSGVGPFTVTTGLYGTCPGAGITTPIPGTSCTFDLPDEGFHELTCVPSGDVRLPTNLYFGLSFSRDKCGVVVGAPPTMGFSADRFDFPGWACDAWFNGYPDFPHASFYLDVYVKSECDEAFVGYKNTMQAGNGYSPGAGVYYADDIHLGVNECRLIGYEVGVKGYGIFKFDVRTYLSDLNPETGGVIPRTQCMFVSVGGDTSPIRRCVVDPPIALPGPDLWIMFKTSSEPALGGVIFTNRQASYGTTEDTFAVYRDGEWQIGPYSAGTIAAFEVTILCAGSPPVGACCDMVLTDEAGESVCRELPKVNCGSPEPELWVEDEVCDAVCVGGDNDGEPCTRQADCPGYTCIGGARDGLVCDPTRPVSTECPGGLCKRGRCPGPFTHPCGQSACCTHDDYCFNYTENECYARPPLDAPRTFERGKFCNYQGYACPWHICGMCPCCPWDGSPGWQCVELWCCQAVCDFDPWCCAIEWDAHCWALTFSVCTGKPPNDVCWNADVFRGAMLVNVPSSTEGDNLHATENATDPGFCCNNTVPGAKGFGTTWFKFVAPEAPPGQTTSSVSLRTCASNAPATDSLLSAYTSAAPDRGVCDDFSICSVSAQDCADGSTCVFDDQYACQNLLPIGCSDDVAGCSASNRNSSLCLTDLVPGQTYFVLVASKVDIEASPELFKVAYRLDVSSPCTVPLPPMPNDYCQNATQLPEQEHVIEPFDLSGGGVYAPATFHCPGEPCLGVVLQNDTWYEWTAPCHGETVVTTCDPDLAPVDQPNTSMAVYWGCTCPFPIGSLIDCSWVALGECGLSSKVEFEAFEGQCYLIRLGGHLGETPAGDLRIDMDCPRPCPAGAVRFVDPPEGVVDARMPHPPGDPYQRLGIDALLIEAPPGAHNLDCWSLCETAMDASPNAITGIVENGDGTFTMTLDRAISTGAVTTLTYTDANGVGHTGALISHPGNVRGYGPSSAIDILVLIDIINGVWPAPCGIYSTDCDHSGTVNAADILCLIDLLNGADAFNPWLGVPVPAGGACGRICGGCADLPCRADEFCKFPSGECHIPDNVGLCTLIPSDCYQVYDPVCGCDGITYSNECYAAMAGVSLLHRGECEP